MKTWASKRSASLSFPEGLYLVCQLTEQSLLVYHYYCSLHPVDQSPYVHIYLPCNGTFISYTYS